jgi:hypothetical protein
MKDKFYIKFVELDKIYNFIVDDYLFKVVWMSKNV